MIHSKKDYIEFRKRDGTFQRGLRAIFFTGGFKFKVLLRKAEYYSNCNTNIWHKLLGYVYSRRAFYYGRKLGYSIPLNVFGPGLSLPHSGTIVVNPLASIGSDCRLHVCVNIGASGGISLAPKIGNGVYIAPGAKIYGDIIIADGIAIGANSVVNKSFLDPGVTIAGMPAEIIGNGGSKAAGWSKRS